jgi:hypothetical protein
VHRDTAIGSAIGGVGRAPAGATDISKGSQMRRRILSFLTLALAGAALSGCAGNVRISETLAAGALDPQSELGYAARDGRAVRVVVYGAAFPDAAAPLVPRVIAAMQGANPGPVVRFSADGAVAADPAYRVALHFNGAVAETSEQLCAGQPAPDTAPVPGRVRLMAVFCVDNQVISETVGDISGVEGPADPAFRDLVRQTTLAVFPRDPVENDEDGGNLKP